MPRPVRRPLAALSPWEVHVRAWRDCRRCALADCRTEVVLYRGELPCDVLFVGEAPGRNEDATGKPFVGPAGSLLDRIVDVALGGLDLPAPPALGFANLIACIPLAEDGDKTEAPPPEAVAACAPRVADLVRLAAPKLLVRVGKEARHHLTPGYRDSVRVPFDGPVCDLYHPAWMLRKPDAFRDMEAQRASVILRAAVHDALTGDPDDPPRRTNLDRQLIPGYPDDDIPF